MVHVKDESVTEEDGQESPASTLGRVEVDSRGRNIWRWARNLAESTSVLLKRLESTDLHLEATQQVKARIRRPQPPPSEDEPLGLAGDEGRDAGGGFDPYNRTR